MAVDFTDLELLAQLTVDFAPQELLDAAAPLYDSVPLHELFDLLESAVESYTLVRHQLTTVLRQSAEQEIEFFLSLLQERLDMLLEPAKSTAQPKNLKPQLQLV